MSASSKKRIDIVGLGYCGLDYLSIVPKIPIDDKVEIIESLVQGGGPAATAIFAAQRLGAQTAFLGAVGDDERGRNIISELDSEGVDCSGVACQKGARSPAAFCWVVQASGKRSIAWTKGTTSALPPSSINPDLIASAKILHLDGHHTQAAIFASRLARDCGTRVVLDAGTMLPDIEQVLANTDVVIASENFARTYTGESDIHSALNKLATESSAEWIAITMGCEGSIAFDGKKTAVCPSFNVNVVDTTGAGDVFHGAFIYKSLESGDMMEIMRFASAVSAMKCGELGGRTGIPNLKAVNEFIKAQS